MLLRLGPRFQPSDRSIARDKPDYHAAALNFVSRIVCGLRFEIGAGAYPLALGTENQQRSDDRLPRLKNPLPEGGNLH
jgi:hypothetical protein